jgi:hypothetical protein
MLLVTVVLIMLHGPDGTIVQVNPAEITLMRPAPAERRGHFDVKVQCLINLADGKNAAVVETCDEVKALIERR